MGAGATARPRTAAAAIVSRFPTFQDRLVHWALHAAGGLMLRRFDRRLRDARRVNDDTLKSILLAHQDTVFGLAHAFSACGSARDWVSQFRYRVPLSVYADYEDYVAQIAAGGTQVLTAEPVLFFARTAGTTARPKLIPRTRRSQRGHISLVVIAEQAVIDRRAPGARAVRRGINLMSLAGPTFASGSAVAATSGPNAGMQRIRKQIPSLYLSPVAAFEVAHQSTALYLHALFGLRHRDALFIETPFAPKIVGWVGSMEQHQAALVADLRHGTLSEHLVLTREERSRLARDLRPDPDRADEVAAAFREGPKGVLHRLWPGMVYIKTIASGSFAVSLPRLEYLAGPGIAIQSTAYAASEGVIGINLATDGSSHYALAVGTAYFEFIPISNVDDTNPRTCTLEELTVGDEYELVMTTWSGFSRYRLGDIVRVTGWRGEAPVMEMLYRRGTILNLVGDKTTELQTHRAITATLRRWLGATNALKDYSVAACFEGNVAQYTFYVELAEELSAADPTAAEAILDQELTIANPFYHCNGREPERMAPARLRIVRSGTFGALGELQLARSGGVTPAQLKTPRVVSDDEQVRTLERGCLG